MKIFKYYTGKDKKNIWTKMSSLGQEPTFNYFIVSSLLHCIFYSYNTETMFECSTIELVFGCSDAYTKNRISVVKYGYRILIFNTKIVF